MDTALLLWIVLLLPLLCGVACFACPSGRAVMALIRAGVFATAALAVACLGAAHKGGSLAAAWNWLYLDALSSYHLGVMMVVFSLSSFYLPGYFREEINDALLSVREARRFGSLWFGALAAMILVLISNNIAIMWVGIEATTLVTAFLICTHRSPESLEAMWKYLIICSVGVAFAFMGTLLAGATANGLHLPASQSLLWTVLRDHAPQLSPALIRVAFIFLLVGYGAKAGLAPMHSWLPDAHSQAPAPVSAIFSGFMLNAALYCIIRFIPLVEGSLGHSGWSLHLLLFFGLFSLIVAAAFIIFQRDMKRLLAYSSVEHIGIIAIGLGLGGLGSVAAFLHMLNHSICKPLAFFAAGRLGQIYGSHDISKMSGAMRTEAIWGKGLFGALLALIGVAPFGMFLSEFMILRAAARSASYWSMGLFLTGAGIVFIGVLQHAISIAWGEPTDTAKDRPGRRADNLLVIAALSALLVLGLWIPRPLWQLITEAAHIVEGTL